MHTETNDRDLLAAVAVDPRAFEAFYRRHVDRVIGFAARRLRDPADVTDVWAGGAGGIPLRTIHVGMGRRCD